MTEWQPIRSATTGTQVIAYRSDSRVIEITWVSVARDHPMYAYTHWMPLPEKPEVIIKK